MKFHWFHLMPYPDLPMDFSQKYPSVWVTPPSHLYEGKVMHKAYHEYLDELEFAEKMGFDGICVNEHHQTAYGLMPAPNIIENSARILPSNRIHCTASTARLRGSFPPHRFGLA